MCKWFHLTRVISLDAMSKQPIFLYAIFYPIIGFTSRCPNQTATKIVDSLKSIKYTNARILRFQNSSSKPLLFEVVLPIIYHKGETVQYCTKLLPACSEKSLSSTCFIKKTKSLDTLNSALN